MCVWGGGGGQSVITLYVCMCVCSGGGGGERERAGDGRHPVNHFNSIVTSIMNSHTYVQPRSNLSHLGPNFSSLPRLKPPPQIQALDEKNPTQDEASTTTKSSDKLYTKEKPKRQHNLLGAGDT